MNRRIICCLCRIESFVLCIFESIFVFLMIEKCSLKQQLIFKVVPSSDRNSPGCACFWGMQQHFFPPPPACAGAHTAAVSVLRSQELQSETADLRERIKHLNDMVFCQQRKVKGMIEEVRPVYSSVAVENIVCFLFGLRHVCQLREIKFTWRTVNR